MADFRALVVWQKARALSLRADAVARRIRRRKPRLADQLERASESIMAAIAEGRGRSTDKDFAHYVSIAIGSSAELENHLQRVLDLGLMLGREHEELTRDTIEVRKMPIGLRKRLLGGGK
jgi:four helix bundle protein